jgi:hypothetical protein
MSCLGTDVTLMMPLTQTFFKGLWRNGSASDSRSEGWELESLWPHFHLLTLQEHFTDIHGGRSAGLAPPAYGRSGLACIRGTLSAASHEGTVGWDKGCLAKPGCESRAFAHRLPARGAAAGLM